MLLLYAYDKCVCFDVLSCWADAVMCDALVANHILFHVNGLMELIFFRALFSIVAQNTRWIL